MIFPQIETIHDVIPFIKGYPEFKILHKDGYSVITYMVNNGNTFKGNDHSASIRRECRGLKFYPDGRIASRPFHKFFNVNETEETQLNQIDLTKPHKIQVKLDGSFFTPVLVNNQIQWMTKAGITDFSPLVENWVNDHFGYNQFATEMIGQNVTPIFEFCSPDNKVVIFYEQPQLTLLALRDNFTGEYLDYPMELIKKYEIAVVDELMEGFESINHLIDFVRPLENQEGFVIVFEDGFRVKIKADQYILIHKSLDQIKHNRHIVQMMNDGCLDDVLSILPQSERTRVNKYLDDFGRVLRRKETQLIEDLEEIKYNLDGSNDRGLIARMIEQTIDNRFDKIILFSMLNGKTAYDSINYLINKNLSKNVSFNEIESWLFSI